MLKRIEQNKENIITNKHSINENEKNIKENKSAIEDLKRNHVPYAAFESTQSRLDRIIHRLIIALIMALALLFISNAIWLYSWHKETGGTTIINKDGTSNFIGENGTIGG